MQTKSRLLFVDDEERIVNLLRMMFRADYEVHTATSGAAALEIIAAHPIDVIVSDQRMPGMLGIELLNEVRLRSPATMRILLTGYSDLSAIVGSVNEGEVFRFINKPWDNAEIRETIAQAAQAAAATAQLFNISAGAASAAASNSSNGQAEAGVLILDDSPSDCAAIREILSPPWVVHEAASIPQALRALAEHDIGVIVAEARVGGGDTGQFLRLLKNHYSAITTVILTRSADADLVVKLINGSQIFRFATKPIRASALQLAVQAGMKEHQRLKASPALAQRHRTVEAKEPEDASLLNGVLQSLTRWRSRLHKAFS